MIDIHSHILFGVDDGAKTIEDSVAMAQAAVQDGVHAIIATPHHRNGTFVNERTAILQRTEELNKRLVAEEIDLTVLPGQEARLHGKMIEELADGKALPLNDNSGYVFVELPHDQVPRYAKRMLFDLQVEGYTPIVVHPERNKELIQNPDHLYEFVQNGALTQLTAASLVGNFGKKIARFSHQLIESNLVHFLASDAHNTSSRGFVLQKALKEVEETYGKDTMLDFYENAELMVKGERVLVNEPMPVKRKKILGIF
ncbi:tyrosine protein phosphatase [Pontibacillus halophilus JSM 076056 = DSM 19796]|uniref:Tyrosine-protein phosphatase n=1 Tax=Pontibacillus halophilus JSM 076056 = DSM 19796 TaxID=1385510 RepID=A0A0A5IDJ6_9BACI|nr:CpsB/CapC family capsule biosynthesis tyrosine phosphatase [Pontibacillus halophilus]KGX93917.1 tyrosine protein phosphatase [Pontibacillus halophilus JSM 076056 = DSM 19796]